MKLFICQSCGHISYENKPEKCPVCQTFIFERNDSIFTESEEKSREAAVKHVPAVTAVKSCDFIPENECIDIMVRIGSTLHPMDEKHFINFIDCYCDLAFIGRVFLTPGLNPAACFHLKDKGKVISIVEHCTVHGYWMTDTSLE